ncbi:hypothetical protein [Streptomyces aureus]|uniref:hypothetical protein n=1 Tax=Streptomyces aureus TaxID=193461 RepID=UPI0006E3D4D1|nr:hypothetical protein [Streptomyces aureus]
MKPRTLRRRATAALAALAACAALTATQGQAQAAPAADALTPATRFYVDPQSKAAKQALADLGTGDLTSAVNMARLTSRPQAEWFTEGTPDEVRARSEPWSARPGR